MSAISLRHGLVASEPEFAAENDLRGSAYGQTAGLEQALTGIDAQIANGNLVAASQLGATSLSQYPGSPALQARVARVVARTEADRLRRLAELSDKLATTHDARAIEAELAGLSDGKNAEIGPFREIAARLVSIVEAVGSRAEEASAAGDAATYEYHLSVLERVCGAEVDFNAGEEFSQETGRSGTESEAEPDVAPEEERVPTRIEVRPEHETVVEFIASKNTGAQPVHLRYLSWRTAAAALIIAAGTSVWVSGSIRRAPDPPATVLQSPPAEPAPSPSPAVIPPPPIPQKRASIAPSPLRYVRMREQPTTRSAVVGQVKPGAQYQYSSVNGGWYLLVDSTGKRLGWVKGSYVTEAAAQAR